jgi:AP endonuclease-1
MPPKRKIVEESSVDGSSGLSSPLSQGDLDVETPESKPTAAKKRKIAISQTSKGNTAKKEVRKDDDSDEKVRPAPKRQTRKKVAVKEEEEEVGAEEAKDLKPAPKKQPRKKVAVKEETTEADGDEPAAVAKPAAKKRKTKEEKEAEAMPLAARTIGHKLFIGAHVSSAGGQYFFRVQLCSVGSKQETYLLSLSLSPCHFVS